MKDKFYYPARRSPWTKITARILKGVWGILNLRPLCKRLFKLSVLVDLVNPVRTIGTAVQPENTTDFPRRGRALSRGARAGEQIATSLLHLAPCAVHCAVCPWRFAPLFALRCSLFALRSALFALLSSLFARLQTSTVDGISKKWIRPMQKNLSHPENAKSIRRSAILYLGVPKVSYGFLKMIVWDILHMRGTVECPLPAVG